MERVAVDSRLLEPGDFYFALKGERTDGHAFLEEAAKKGAAGAVVSEKYQGPSFGLSLLAVEDVLDCLQETAKIYLNALSLKTVGVTGSVGKTTTKGFVSTLLEERFVLASSPGNYNSQIGLPLTLLNHIQGNEEILVQEMAMTHAGQIAKLASIAPPDVALITNVSLVHACNFSSLEEIARAKGEIFTSPETKVGILPKQMPYFDEIASMGTCKKVTFSLQDLTADYFLDENNRLFVEGKKAWCFGKFPFTEEHLRQNILAAVAVARQLEMEWKEIERGLKKLTLPKMRFEKVEKQGILFVNDSYNASEESMKAALRALPKGKRTIAVLGEMLELGKFSEACHNAVAEVALEVADQVICMGEGFRPVVEEVPLFTELKDVTAALKKIVEPGDVVLLKGSNGNQLWRVLEEF